MGFVDQTADTLPKAIARSDEFFYFFANIDDEDPTASSLTINQCVRSIAVSPDSDMDKFSMVYIDPASGLPIVQYISPESPWVARLPIGADSFYVDINNARHYTPSVLTGGIKPTAGLVFLLGDIPQDLPRARVPKIISGAFTCSSPASVASRIYCYGRKTFSLVVRKTNSANDLDVTVVGQCDVGSAPLISATIATGNIPIGGGGLILTGSCAGWSRLTVFGDGPTAPGEATFSLEVVD